MEFTSEALSRMAKIGGLRCCKRDALISLDVAVDFINENYDVILEKSAGWCSYSKENQQCIG